MNYFRVKGNRKKSWRFSSSAIMLILDDAKIWCDFKKNWSPHQLNDIPDNFRAQYLIAIQIDSVNCSASSNEKDWIVHQLCWWMTISLKMSNFSHYSRRVTFWRFPISFQMLSWSSQIFDCSMLVRSCPPRSKRPPLGRPTKECPKMALKES